MLVQELFNYKTMIFSLVKRDLRGRYKRSALGFLWNFLNPLFQLLIYTFVFSVILKNSIPKYYLFLFVTLIPWMFFSGAVMEGSSCVLGQSALVTKIYFPREVLPVAFTLYQFVNMCLSFIVVFVVIAITGYGVNWIALLWLLPLSIIFFCFVLGWVLIVSALTVYFRDLQQIISIATLALQFLSPVLYGIDAVPEKYRNIFMLNPLSSIFCSYRDILYYKKIPDLQYLSYGILVSVIFMLLGFIIFRKLSKRFAEVI